MASTNASARNSKEVQQAKGGGSLHDRLRARHRDAIEKFKVAARQFNNEVDEAQQVRIEELHSAIANSHAVSAALLEEEQRRLAECLGEWQAHEDAVQHAAPDDILPLYTDKYYTSADELGRARALSLMEQDRLRVVQHFVDLHDHYKLRMRTIAEYFRAIEAAEEARRLHIQDRVRDLMASLTRIAVTSTTESQVLAQRILHHTNEQLGENYLAIQTLATQLRQRELWKHQRYQHTLATVYRDTQQHMANRHITWAVTVLRSSVFRRPEGRLRSVHAAGQLIAAIRKEAEELVRGLTEVVLSLQVAQPSIVTAESQVCGGSGANGWLRSFQPSVHQRDVFAGENPRAVLEEAQMRASVVVRHCQTRCADFNGRLRAEEEARAQAATALATQVCHDIATIATPLSEEVALLQAASLSHDDVGAGDEAEVGDADGVWAVDAALRPLTQPHASLLALQETLPHSATWSPCVPGIVQEGEWFVRVVSRGLLRGCQLFCAYATTSNSSMMVHLEGATDLLFSSATALLGAARAFYVQWHEQEMDYQDAVAELERQLHTLEEQLQQDETPAAADARYAAGIACLQSIADAHTHFYEDVRGRITAATSAMLRVGQDCVRELCAQLGLVFVTLTGEDSAPATAVCAPAKRRSSAVASRRASVRASILSTATAPPPRMSVSAVAEAEVDTRPRVSATHGEEFVEECPNFRFACEVQRGEDGAADTVMASPTPQQEEEGQGKGCGAEVALSAPEPSTAFQRFYLDLLPELQPDQGPLFLKQSEVHQWDGLLRQALLEWGLQLQRQAGENWRLYTTALLADVQRRVSDILRHHRRRPATLQANIYEARMRELADLKNRGEKMLARIAERVSHVHTLQQGFLAQPACSSADRTLLEERAQLMEAVYAANSGNAMKAAIHRHDKLCAEYNAALADRCAETKLRLEQARDSIEAECAQILRDRAAELSGGGDTSAALSEKDPIQLRVVQLRTQVQNALDEATAAMEAQYSSRASEIQNWKEEWAKVVEHSAAELELFQGVQEALSCLRAHVQTLLSASATEEAALAAGVQKVTEASARAQETNAYDLVASLQALLRNDAASGGGASGNHATGVEELPPLKEVETAVTRALEIAKTEQRERIRAAPVCAVLAMLDDLRMPFYSRGCQLGLLAHSVEMWRMLPAHYLLPQTLGGESVRHHFSRIGSAGRVGSARDGRRTRSIAGAESPSVAASVGHTLLLLPAVPTLMAQVTQRTAELKANAQAAARQHVEAHPGALHRRLPDMTDGTEAGFVAAVSSLCQAQEDRVRSYADKAGPAYRQHVQELWNALQGTPALLAAALEAEAAAGAFTRVEGVLRPWQHYQTLSAQQWQRHRSSAKLSLASQLNSEALTTLTEAEAARSAATAEALQQSWSWTLRELQDEAGLHVARCWTALYTYLHLLAGLVTPQHLVSTVEVVEGGQHRGLRHLLELRAQRERAMAAMDASAVVKREPRLQETMPLHRIDQAGAAGAAGGSGKRHVNKSGDKAAGAKDASGTSVPTLTPLPLEEVELPGLPLNACAPLSQYNASHPDTALLVAITAALYVPSVSGVTRNDGGATLPGSSVGGRRQNPGTTTTSSAAGSRKDRPLNSSNSAAVTPANAIELSIPLVVPRSPLALECAQLLSTIAHTVPEEDNEAARVLSDAFSFWERHEAQLRQTWALTIAELTSEQP